MPAGELASIPAGVQPEEDGRLLCRLCGRWFRALGHHLLRKHETTVEDYQAQFELPAGRGLAAVDLRQAQARRGSDRLVSVPAARAGFLLDESLPADEVAVERQRRAALGREGLAEKKSRAGVRAAWVAHGEQLGAARRQWAAGRREELDGQARALGFADFADLVAGTRELTHPAFAALLGWPGSQGLARATWWRLQHGGTSEALQAGARQRRREQRAGLEEVPAGVQPVAGGRLRCLDCGRWFTDLGQHVQRGHGQAVEEYRARHQLPAGVALRGADCREGAGGQLAAVARAGGQAAGRRKAQAARAGYDLRARELGFADVTALLRERSNAQVTVLLGLGRGQAYRIRQRYLPGGSGS